MVCLVGHHFSPIGELLWSGAVRHDRHKITICYFEPCRLWLPRKSIHPLSPPEFLFEKRFYRGKMFPVLLSRQNEIDRPIFFLKQKQIPQGRLGYWEKSTLFCRWNPQPKTIVISTIKTNRWIILKWGGQTWQAQDNYLLLRTLSTVIPQKKYSPSFPSRISFWKKVLPRQNVFSAAL